MFVIPTSGVNGGGGVFELCIGGLSKGGMMGGTLLYRSGAQLEPFKGFLLLSREDCIAVPPLVPFSTVVFWG